MKRNILLIIFSAFFILNLSAQSDDELFGGDDDLFFSDDGIIELEDIQTDYDKKTENLNHGLLFETGSVKIGGSFDLSLTTMTSFPKDKEFKDSLWDTTLSPTADANITIDARPSENLRMYMKTGISYPYVTKNSAALIGMNFGQANILVSQDTSLKNMFYIKELFSDFSFGENVSMRFGKQTVTWGVGYFYSPADVINAAIDPENPTAQVEGPLALRTQIVFPGSQNALWAYIIPDNNFTATSNFTNYARDTALALKGEIILGGWELGLGTWFKNDYSPRIMTTASGTVFRKISVFGEGVVAFGQDSEWKNNTEKNIFAQATAGLMYNWKTPEITLMGQYFYSGQDDNALLDSDPSYAIGKRKGHNAALAVNFGKVVTRNLSGSIYSIMNFTNETLISSASLSWSPINEFKLTFGPYLSWIDFEKDPVASMKITFTLGGGKF